MGDGLALAVACALVLVNACFVAAEYSIVTIRRSKIETLVRAGSRRGRLLEKIVTDLDAHISAVQLAITTVGLAIGWIGEPAVAHHIQRLFALGGIDNQVLVHSVSFAIAFFAITMVVVVLGELAPKFLGLRRTERVALWTAPLVYGFARLTRPLLVLMNSSATLALSMIGVTKSEQNGDDMEPEELRIMLTELQTMGRMSPNKREMLENVFEFSDHTARQVMVPRDQIEFLALDKPLEENLALVKRSRHTRYPLCESKLDTAIGMIHIKDLFQSSDAIQTSKDLRLVMHDMLFVPESQSIDDLQKLFQRRRAHMAMVVDEYGVPTGLVTMEDVLEELVGEIQDEFDNEQPKILESREGLLVDGMLLFDDLCRQLDFEFDAGELEDVDADTVGGFVTSALGKIGRVGDRFDIAGHTGRVVEMQGRRVARVLLEDLSLPEPQESPEVAVAET